MEQLLEKRCIKPGCEVQNTGQCLDGNEMEKCPHYVSNSIDQDAAVPINNLALNSGEDLNFDSANKITSAALTRVIVLAGAVDAGKTTFLASLYEKFLEGSFAGYFFAGSQTLIGFERRCHLSRIASGRATPETQRTPKGFEHALLHLKVRDEGLSQSAIDLLLTDISGETYRLARDYSDECKKLKFLKRADQIAIFIDGGKIADFGKRHEAFSDIDLLLRSLIESEMVDGKSYVGILFSKKDIIDKQAHKDEIMIFVDKIKATLSERYASKLGRLDYYFIASRPEDSDLPFAFGLADVLKTWITISPFTDLNSVDVSEDIIPYREFDRFLLKKKILS